VPISTDVIDAIRVLRRSLTRAATAAFAETGVGPKQVVVLRELRRVGKASQVELSRATATDPAAMMRAIDALEGRGWVQRSSCEDDRRCKLVSLTPEGRRALRGIDVSYEALRSLANGALASGERKQFCELAAKVGVILEAAGAAAPADDDEP
jgi:MarR family 2-MHQ and catechol resistance regulon transcriptional repressor